MKLENKEIYYSDGTITVQQATREDAEYISFNMRKQDVDEIWAAAHMTPAAAMQYSINNTIFCLSIRISGVPCAVFGVNGESVVGRTGVVWLLGTPAIETIKYRFVKHSRKFVDLMLEFYPVISNYVSIENTVSIAWLKFLGATFDLPKQYGIEGKLFKYFYFKRGV